MPKKYTLLIDSPEYPKDSEATQDHNNSSVYNVTMPKSPYGNSGTLMNFQVEDRPTVWQEIVEVPEKKIVERWRGNEGEYYFTISTTRETEQNRFIDEALYCTGDYFQAPKVCTRANQRIEIMCRLMGLAETIEEGSTECRGKWTLGYYVSNTEEKLLPVSCATYIMHICKIATFSTEKLAQLFLDSAGQDAIDWYGAVK